MPLNAKTQQLIDKLYKGNSHVDLAIAVLSNGQVDTLHLDARRQEVERALPVYPAGSICPTILKGSPRSTTPV